MGKKKIRPEASPKGKLHQRNLHNAQYDLETLTQVVPELKDFIVKNVRGEDTVKFAEPKAVFLLNKALLFQYYDIEYWEIPTDYLTPPVPGRADYIHHASDLLAGKNFGNIPKAHVLDIGTGSNCIYPILGTKLYDWSFIGTDTDKKAMVNTQRIIENNKRLHGQLEIRQQVEPKSILEGVIQADDRFDLVMCNPPFHSSTEEAEQQAKRKVKNLNKGKQVDLKLNFGGQQNELWYPGGERRFISNLVNESKTFANQVFWFTSLVSKAAHLKALEDSLDYHKAVEVRTINMSQGNKASRILAWTFLTNDEQKEWKLARWK